ncbi:MAG: tRNA (adenosine(37)-N6)-threonylcarbamoyltransferase complex ATPase subunit type 1 TsaE, partial [Thermodesulfovibrionales bacterium]|nr:tRNA (adenosine(37)-N6)-threonylcarbamoyltransferase complex ATPase subunit type 1 TsaE [Thermodesulfovibrionales bacterium]
MEGIRIISSSPEKTEDIGYKLGKLLKSTGKGVTIYLFGDLGAGKTVFVKGLGRAFGISPRDIGSASFIIVAEYDSSPPFYHIDLYRLEGDIALESVGIWEYIDGDGITAIE